MSTRAALAGLATLLFLTGATHAYDEDEDTGPWQEKAITLPSMPARGALPSYQLFPYHEREYQHF